MQIMGIALDALNEELIADGSRKSLCEMALLHGDAVLLDYGAESCGGMGWVRLVSVGTTAQFPNPDVAGTCVSDLMFSMEMGVIRPAPMPETFSKRLVLPSADDQGAATSLALDDMLAMRRALKAVSKVLENFALGGYSPMGPEGAVVGGVWTFTAGEELED